MAFQVGTRQGKVELTVGTLPSLKVGVLETVGEVPPNLASAAQLLIELFKANGDLAWLMDMVAEAESDSISPRSSQHMAG